MERTYTYTHIVETSVRVPLGRIETLVGAARFLGLEKRRGAGGHSARAAPLSPGNIPCARAGVGARDD